MAIAGLAPGLSPNEGSRRDTRGRLQLGGGEMVRRASMIAVARLGETRLGLTMIVDRSRLLARDARLTARAETSSSADPVLSPIDRRPSRTDAPDEPVITNGGGFRPN
jgi:hypothetical protein